MPVSVHIEGESAAAVRAEMSAFLGGYDKAPAPTSEAAATVAIAGTNVITAADPKTRGGRRGGAVAKVETPPAEVQAGSPPLPPPEAPPAAAAAAEPEKKPLTLDDVRAAAAPYIKKFTIAAAQEDLQYALDAAVGKRTMSALDVNNQDELAKAVAAFDAAAAAEARFPKPADWK